MFDADDHTKDRPAEAADALRAARSAAEAWVAARRANRPEAASLPQVAQAA
ncbi:MAG: hypothetical protein AAF713_05410 [Pseudomonadota bacterium]